MTGVALVGHGEWGRNHAKVLRRFGVLACIIDSAQPNPKDQGDTPWFQSLDQAIRAMPFDAAVIATPAASHELIAFELIRQHKHVLIEKPVAFSVSALTKMYKLADDDGLILMSGHLLQYHPAVEAMSSLIESGEIGQVRYASSVRSSLGKVRTAEDVLWSFAPHDVGLILGAFGRYPISVSARYVDVLRRGVPDAAFIALQYDDGRAAAIQVNWLSPVKEQRFTVAGSKGSLTFNDQEPPRSKITLARYAPSQQVSSARRSSSVDLNSTVSFAQLADGTPLESEVAHFLASINDENDSSADRWLTCGVIQVLDLASKSALNAGVTVPLGP